MIPFCPLTDEEHSTFDRNGFLVLRGVLPELELTRVLEAAESLLASCRTQDREVQPGYGRIGDATWRAYRNCFSIAPQFRPLLTLPRILSAIVQLLSCNIHVISSQCVFRDSAPRESPRIYRTPMRPGWHRDLYGPGDDLGHAQLPRLAIKVLFALNDATEPSMGGTLFAPGSHLWRRAIQIPAGELDPPGPIECPRLAAGDAVLFENRLYHAGEWNYSGKTRKFFVVQYAYRWIAPVDYRVHSAEMLIGCNPIEMQLLDAIEDRDKMGQILQGKGAQPLRHWTRSDVNRAGTRGRSDD